MKPSCLRVDMATIFFKSFSERAEIAPKTLVPPQTQILQEGKEIERKAKYTPAETKVEEWTRALTGVGAAIASGNQTLKGSWALFEKQATIKKNTKAGVQRGALISKSLKQTRKNPSPARLTKKVTWLEAREYHLL